MVKLSTNLSFFIVLVALEKFRLQLAEEHSAKVKKREEDLLNIQKERQAVFQEAFQQDLNNFRQNGEIPSKLRCILYLLANCIEMFCWKRVTLSPIMNDNSSVILMICCYLFCLNGIDKII